MVRAWYMDNNCSDDQRKTHMTDPPEFLDLDSLKNKTGIEYFKINADDYQNDETLQKIRNERNYTYEDLLDCRQETLPDYDKKLKIFFTEHLHTDEEIRLCVDGSGYFDARDTNDRWVRVEIVKGDMIILPAGIYHRFTLDEQNYIKAARYFVGEPVWKAHDRPSDDMEARKQYLASMKITS